MMGVLKLGFVTIYLADPLISGFTTGAACHVFTSQVKYILGIGVERFNGPLKLIYVCTLLRVVCFSTISSEDEFLLVFSQIVAVLSSPTELIMMGTILLLLLAYICLQTHLSRMSFPLHFMAAGKSNKNQYYKLC